jgi:hypothetical protein
VLTFGAGRCDGILLTAVLSTGLSLADCRAKAVIADAMNISVITILNP